MAALMTAPGHGGAGMPPDHPLRYALTNELHARPVVELVAPEQATHLAMVSRDRDVDHEAAERCHLEALCARYGVAKALGDATHFTADFGPFRLKWERHTEFTTYTFFHRGKVQDAFLEPAISLVPADWLAGLPGERIVAANVTLLPAEDADAAALIRHLVPESLCRGQLVDGAAEAATDFRIHGDGFSRILILDRGLLPRQAGRLVQRLLELKTYRNMALLALPLARQVTPAVTRIDQSLATLTARMKALAPDDDERVLLDQLMSLSTEIEESIATTSYRFSAARAYHALVTERMAQLREQRVGGYPTLCSFVERRLAPAMRTCESVAARQLSLSERATRAADLLRTRVDIKLEGQNRDLLTSMDRRARLQLRLQQTVEGLSVAAITYYVVSLLGYLLKSLGELGLSVPVYLLQGLSVPFVALLVWWGARTVRKKLKGEEG